METIAIISAVIGLLSTIGGLFVGLWKIFKKIDSIQDEFRENMIETLKLVVINKSLPEEERINAGKKYIKMGGNGSVKKLVLRLEDEAAQHLIDEE